MEAGHFCFIKEEYFLQFNDPNLMGNHEKVGDELHGRPCYMGFVDDKTGLVWAIPISSKIGKFKALRYKKTKKYGKCDTIEFANVLGGESAFLIQNMCPLTENYIDEEYTINGNYVAIDKRDMTRIVGKAKKILAIEKQGRRILFPDVLKIEQQLLKQLVTT